MTTKTALITGITGQDGALLAESLLSKGYIVHGIKRRSSSFNTERLDHLYKDRHDLNSKLFLHFGDLTDSSSITRIIQETNPSEIYNLGAMSHVHASFDLPEYTADVNATGTLRILESIRLLGKTDLVKFYQASSSELYGKVVESPQNESSKFHPRSPYAVAKLFGYWITINYREAFGMHASNGILFNHESELRGETFVTRKITRAVSAIVYNLQDEVLLGNLDAKRDWGHAKDYVEAMQLILQQDKPDDYVVATGNMVSVREFAHKAFSAVGIELSFEGEGIHEVGIIRKLDKKLFQEKVNYSDCHLEINKIVLRVSEEYFRPAEVEELCGDFSKAKEKLHWEPKFSLDDLVRDMINSDLNVFFEKRILLDKNKT